MRAGILAALALAALAACSPPEPATPPDPTAFSRQVLMTPLNEPVSLDALDDGSVLVVERRGRILHWRPGQGDEAGASDGGVTEILTIDDLFFGVHRNSEFGLLAIAVDPRFERNRIVYLMYDVVSNGVAVQRVSRLPYIEPRMDRSREEVLLEFPIDDNCCHTGGAIKFGPDGNLYIATGDNTNPFESDGFGPMDNRPDRDGFDALRTAGNTMNLSGKILRIRPRREGGYTIPAGNLFTDPAVGRPEIYVMGARNPYTLGFDEETGVLFFGDVGPDADEDTEARGSRGYDEINRITEAANTGWPMFIGNNFPYRYYDFGTGESGPAYDPAAPQNNSPRNNGARVLPPAQPPLIYYPYAASELYPQFGQGGRNALAAGVYHRPRNAGAEALPRYYDGKLIISDFMRRWMFAVTLNADGTVQTVEPFAPNVSLAAPLDFDFGADGTLYVLEYGSRWFQGNDDAALSRIVFTGTPQGSASGEQVAAAGHQAAQGAALLEEYACISCHQIDDESVGPAYRQVAARYADRADAAAYISGKIAGGSSGVWGDVHAMPAMDFIPEEDRAAIAAYILSLNAD